MKALKVAVGDEPKEQAIAVNSTNEATQSGWLIEIFICLPTPEVYGVAFLCVRMLQASAAPAGSIATLPSSMC